MAPLAAVRVEAMNSIQRRELVVALRRDGHTRMDIAARAGLSLSGVRWILAQEGMVRHRSPVDDAAVLEAYRRLTTMGRVAEDLGISRSRVRRLVRGPDLSIVTRRRPPRLRWTAHRCVAALREAQVEATEPLTAAMYDRMARHTRHWPALNTVLRRFGGRWRVAMVFAFPCGPVGTYAPVEDIPPSEPEGRENTASVA